MKETFDKEVTFLSKMYDHEAETPGTYKLEPVTKLAHFQELNQVDRKQHLFHFDIMAYFSGQQVPEEKSNWKPNFNSAGTYALTVSYVNDFLIIDPEFTTQDKDELLNDSGALLKLGLWLMNEKIIPFFRQLRKD